MMNLLIALAINTLGVLIAAQLVPGVKVSSLSAAVKFGAIFGVLLFFLGGIFTFFAGLFTLSLLWIFENVCALVVGTIIVKLSDALVDDVKVDGWGSAFLTALAVTVVKVGVQKLMG